MKPIDSSSGVVCALPTTNEPDSSTMNVSVIVPPASIARTRGLRSPLSLMPVADSIPARAANLSGHDRRLLIVALVLLALLGVSQLVIPPIIESRISDRLTAAGGRPMSRSLPCRRPTSLRRGQPHRGHRKRPHLTSQSESGTVFSNLDGFDTREREPDAIPRRAVPDGQLRAHAERPRGRVPPRGARTDDPDRPRLVRRFTARAAGRPAAQLPGRQGRSARTHPGQPRHGGPERRRPGRWSLRAAARSPASRQARSRS